MTPARLALHEDFAAGLQVRARTNVGSFDAEGHYASATGLEQILEQDVALAARVVANGQLSVVIPMIQTHRSAAGLDDWGGGLGDISATARYDLLHDGESVTWPGIAVLAASTLPSGTPPDKASHVLAADATGAGTYDATIGLGLEKTAGRGYFALDGWLTHRFARVLPVESGVELSESFSVRWTVLAVAAHVFDDEMVLGLYASSLNEGPAAINGVRDPTTALRLTTVGASFVAPLKDQWRLQSSLFSDVTASSFGRNESAGYGLTLALVRVWM